MTRSRRLALAIVSLWLGGMLVLGGGVANTVFNVVGQEAGGKIMQRLFPSFYAGSLLCPAAALLLVLAGGGSGARRWPPVLTLLLALAVAAWNAFLLGPRISAVRVEMHAAAGEAQGAVVELFGRLHVQSVATMGLLVVLALAYVLIEVVLPLRARAGPG